MLRSTEEQIIEHSTTTIRAAMGPAASIRLGNSLDWAIHSEKNHKNNRLGIVCGKFCVKTMRDRLAVRW